jgi:hypothetical protein
MAAAFSLIAAKLGAVEAGQLALLGASRALVQSCVLAGTNGR